MRAPLACLIATVVAAAACDGPADAPDPALTEQLAALPGVRVSEWLPPADFAATPGYRFFDLHFTLPLDHDHPETGTFELYAALMHRDFAAPLVVHAGGYDAGWLRYLTEPARLVAGNQLSLEYRFYGTSRPTAIPWSLLRIRQAAADEHAVLATLAALYTGRRIATGGSKGGENALLHHRLYPGDYAGVVAYVTPVITNFPDLRYSNILDRIGDAACRDRLRALARRMLERRDAMASLAGELGSFAIAGVDHAVETGVVELEFSFWMTRGEPDCAMVPDPATADDAALWTFLDETSSPLAYGDEDLDRYGTQYLYQDHVELGYPVWRHGYLDDLMRFSYEDWSVYLPPDEPLAYDPNAARDLDTWLGAEADHVLVVQGEWDPWAAGAPYIGAGRDAYQLWVPHGSHWSSSIATLAGADQDIAVSALRRWAGLTDRPADARARQRGADPYHHAWDRRRPEAVPRPLAPMASRGPGDPRLRRGDLMR